MDFSSILRSAKHVCRLNFFFEKFATRSFRRRTTQWMKKEMLLNLLYCFNSFESSIYLFRNSVFYKCLEFRKNCMNIYWVIIKVWISLANIFKLRMVINSQKEKIISEHLSLFYTATYNKKFIEYLENWKRCKRLNVLSFRFFSKRCLIISSYWQITKCPRKKMF